MNCVVAVVLLAFVVFTCGDPVNVEKREPGGDLGLFAHGILGKDGLSNLKNLPFKELVKAVGKIIQSLRKALEKLNVCPNKKGDYKDGGYGQYEHGYRPGYEPSYEPGYEPNYEPGSKPNYEPGYEPDYVPSPKYKRNADLDLGCMLKPMIDAAVKVMKNLEKMFLCAMGKDDGYKGDYKDCYYDYKKAYNHGYDGDYKP